MRSNVLACAAALAVAGAASADVLYDTGLHDTVLFNGTETNLGWTSGDAGAGFEQRWTVQPFSVADPVHISNIFAGYFIPGESPLEMGWIIWNRSGADAPVDGDQVASGSVAYSGDPTTPFGVDVDLSAGDYYLTIYGIGATIGWFTNAPNPIHFLDGDGNAFMHRSATFPDPGFQFYQLGYDVLDVVDPDVDSRNYLYSAEFRLEGEIIPAPAALALLGVAGLVAGRRRR